MTSRSGQLLVAMALLTVSSLHAIAGAPVIRKIALAGEPANGTTGVFSDFKVGPVITSGGEVVLGAQLAGPGVNSTSDEGTWLAGSAGLSLVARAGDRAPDTEPGVAFASFFGLGIGIPVASRDGVTGFSASLTGVGSPSDTGIWQGRPGAVSLVARAGDVAPGVPSDVRYGHFPFHNPVIRAGGQIAYSADLSGPGIAPNNNNDTGIWAGVPGAVSLVAREGDAAPGVGPNAVYRFIPGYPVMNNNGQLAIHAGLGGSGVTPFQNDEAIWVGTPGNLNVVARSGDPAPGLPNNVTYRGAGQYQAPSMGDNGTLAFSWLLSGTGVHSGNDSAIWTGTPGNLALLAREGDPAPGTSVRFGNLEYFGLPPLVNDAGRVVFRVAVTGTGVNNANDEGIWAGTRGNLVKIAREGDLAPGTADMFLSVGSPVINNAGQVAFSSFLVGSDVTSDNDRGWWATDPSGALQLIVRTGDLIEVRPGDFRIVSGIGTADTVDGEARRYDIFNDAGEFVFKAVFTDGTSGIFVATVPEPATLAILLVGAALLRARAGRPHA